MTNAFALTLLFLIILASVQSCEVGQYLDNNKICQQCDISCATCYSADGCATCYDQMFMVSRGNTVVCDVCYMVNKGCTSCITSTKCSKCSNGYFLLSDNTCSSCQKLVPHCILCTTNGTSCMSCVSPYILSRGVCFTNSTTQLNAIPNTTTNSDNTNSGGQITIQSSTTSNTPSTLNTTNPNPQTVIPTSLCDNNFIQINGNCFIIIPYCQNYNNNGRCSNCVTSYMLHGGYCLPAILMAAISSSSAAVDTPTSTNQNGNENYQTNNAVNCAANQYLSNGNCVTVGPECLTFTQTGRCLACITGFAIYNGLCIQSAPATTTKTTIASNNLQVNSVSSIQTNDPSCTSPCLTCKASQPNFCLSCVTGFGSVDQIPGKCFGI